MSPAAQPQASMAELVGNYADWIYDRRPTVELGIIDLDAARRELARLDPGAIVVDAALPPERQREIRRRVLTAFALEVAALGSIKHASSAGRLVEWACAYVRSHAPLNDYDRAWQRAALSVLEGAIDSHALAEHVDHALPVFRDEPRLALARGIVEEQFNAPNEALVRTPTATGLLRAREALVRMEGESYRASERAIAKFQEAAQHEAVRAEAILRAGHVQMRLGRYDAALATWATIERDTKDPALLFLLHLFRGQALEGRARIDEARRSYEAALAISPRAHSATLRLAALSFRYGHGADAAPLSDALLRDDDPRRDPWWSYYAGDWRLYYPQVDRVRALVKQP
jgi:tetratricopeptide (TPR) repeat protein